MDVTNLDNNESTLMGDDNANDASTFAASTEKMNMTNPGNEENTPNGGDNANYASTIVSDISEGPSIDSTGSSLMEDMEEESHASTSKTMDTTNLVNEEYTLTENDKDDESEASTVKIMDVSNALHVTNTFTTFTFEEMSTQNIKDGSNSVNGENTSMAGEKEISTSTLSPENSKGPETDTTEYQN